MKLSEVFAQLTYGELSQLSLGGAETGQIDPTKYNQVLSHVNLGLTALYKRFPLKEGRVTFKLQAGRITYPLNTRDDVEFVADEGEDFADDIIKIEKIYAVGGEAMGLNDASDPYSCFTPSMTSLRVPGTIAAQDGILPPHLITSSITAVYRANHPIIVSSGASFNPTRVELELPYSHLEPLLLYVASRIHNPIGMTNEFHAGNSYYAKYEKACADLELANIKVDQGSQNQRFEKNGWR